MTVEAATYISDLNAALPAASDVISQGDDHVRLLKSTLKATLPALTGPVTATHTQLNSTAAFVGSLTATTAQLNAVGATLAPGGTTAATGSGFGVVPPGTIVLWQSLSVIPPGWAFCDGANGTPDMRGVFVRGGGPFTPVGLDITRHLAPTASISDPLIYNLAFIMKL